MRSITSAFFCSIALLPAWFSSAALAQGSEASATPGSMLSISAELPVTELSEWLTKSVPSQFVGEGQRTICKRLLGLKACGDARWQYRVDRTGAIRVPQPTQESPNLQIDVPLSVNAVVGVDGDVARALGIRSVPVKADFTALVDISVQGTEWGCPRMQANMTPQWVNAPTALLAGNIKIRLSDVLEEALQKQVESLQKRLNKELDCDRLLAQLNPFWSVCYVDATHNNSGPGIWVIHPQKLHWSMQTVRENRTLGLIAGVDASISLLLGLSAEDVASRLSISDCAEKWANLATPTSTTTLATTRPASRSRLVFDPFMKSNSQQRVRVNITHQAMSDFAQTRYANRNLGKDEGGNEVSLKSVTLLPGEPEQVSTLTLETEFDALLRASEGLTGWVQNLLGFGEKRLSGMMRIQTTPVWNSELRNLQFEALQVKVASLEPGSKLSLTHAAFGLLQRHVQKTVAEQSSVPLGESIDGLSQKLNQALDASVQDKITPYGGLWYANTAALQIDDIAALGEGMVLDATLHANWRVRFSSKAWPVVR